MTLFTCSSPYCGEQFPKPLRGRGRVTSKTVFMCPVCRVAVPRISEGKKIGAKR